MCQACHGDRNRRNEYPHEKFRLGGLWVGFERACTAGERPPVIRHAWQVAVRNIKGVYRKKTQFRKRKWGTRRS